MKIHEYQAKAILKKYGVAVPRGKMATTREEAEAAAKELFDAGATGVVVKAQIHAGGRGKGGGVKIAKSLAEASELAGKILGMNLVTHQTGPEGRIVHRLLIEETLPIEKELYLGILVDRGEGKPVFMASSAGGMDIEQVAAERPEAILKQYVDPGMELEPFEARKIAFSLGLKGSQVNSAVQFLTSLYRAFLETDASLVEINPFVSCTDGRLFALDAKLNLRRQRALPPRRFEGTARRYRRRSARSRSVEIQLELHQARWQRGLHGQWRGAGHGDHGHHQVCGRYAGQLPGCGRRRELRTGGARV